MKKLKSILEASILGNVDDQIKDNDTEVVKLQIREFLNKTYQSYKPIAISAKPNKDGKYLLTAINEIQVRYDARDITSLTNGMFVWDKVYGKFDISGCSKLKSLDGSPKSAEHFLCANCHSLTSLEHGPKQVTGTYNCSDCENITSLKGLPKKVKVVNCTGCKSLKNLKGLPDALEYLYCNECDSLKDLTGAPVTVAYVFRCENCKNLTSLKGSPNIVGSEFSCKDCKNLKSLEHAPKHVMGDFWCGNCGTYFTRDMAKDVSKIDGRVILY